MIFNFCTTIGHGRTALHLEPARSARVSTGSRRDAPATGEQRCDCGNLLARLTPRGLEVKCRRCKRVVELSWEQLGGSRAPPGRSAR
jgi:hypothetical protein